MEPTEPAAGRCVGQLVISVALTAMALVTSPDRRFLQPRRSGRLRDPRLASFVRWDTRPLDVSSPQAPARPGLSLLPVYRRARTRRQVWRWSVGYDRPPMRATDIRVLAKTSVSYQIPLIRTRGPIGAVRWT